MFKIVILSFLDKFTNFEHFMIIQYLIQLVEENFLIFWTYQKKEEKGDPNEILLSSFVNA